MAHECIALVNVWYLEFVALLIVRQINQANRE